MINTLTRITEIAESHVETNVYLAEPQLNTMMKSSRSPRLARIVGWVRAGGVGSEGEVKAVEGYRSPSPGGRSQGFSTGTEPHSYAQSARGRTRQAGKILAEKWEAEK